MLHRHHYMPNIVATDDVPEVDDGPSKKRRKLADRLDGLIESPKAPTVDSRLAFVSSNQQQPVAGTSRDTSQARRSPSLRRHNSLPTRVSAAPNEVLNHLGFQAVPQPVSETVYQTSSSSSSDARFRTSDSLRSRGESSMPFVQPVPLSDRHSSSHVLRPSRESAPFAPLSAPQLPSAYLNVPGTAAAASASSHSGCTPACLSHSVPVSTPFVTNNARPCPSAAQLFPPFSAVGVVPAPVLAAEALPNYYGFLPGLSIPPSHHITYHTSPHVTIPPYPVAQGSVMPSAAPLITHDVDYILPQPSSQPYPAHQSSTLTHSQHPPPPPYSLASSQVFLVDNAVRQNQSSPYGRLLAVPFQPPLVDYRRRSEGPSTSWSSAPLTAPAPPVNTHRPHIDPSQPFFVQHFLAMLETTLGAIHDIHESSSHSHPSYTAPNLHNYEALLGLARQLSENKPKGMSKSDIDRLVTYQYTTGDSESKRLTGDSPEAQTSCVVCMCDFSQRQRVRELPCQHIFHAKCIDKWLKTNRTCPLCRADALDMLNCDDKVSE